VYCSMRTHKGIKTIVILYAMVFFVSNIKGQDSVDRFELALHYPDSFYASISDFNDRERDVFYPVYQYIAKEQLDSAVVHLFEIKNELKDSALISKTNFYLGGVYSESGSFHLGLEFLFKALLYNEVSAGFIISVKEYIGDNYFAQQEYRYSINYYLEVLVHSEAKDDAYRQAWVLNKLGKCYLGLDELSEAEDYFNEAILLFEDNGDKAGIINVFGSMAWSSYKEGDLYRARKNCYHSLRENVALGNVTDELDALYLLGKIEIKEENIKAAISNLKAAMYLADTLQIKRYQRDIALDLYQLFNEQSDYRDANKYLIKYVEVSKELYNDVQSRKAQRLNADYQFNKQQKDILLKSQEIEILKEQERYKNQQLLGVGLLSLLLIVVGILLMKRQKQQKQKELEVGAKEKELMDSKKALVEAKLKSSEWEGQELKNRLEFKNKELQTFALHIVEKNDFLQGLNSDLSILNGSVKNDAASILLKEIRSKVSYNLSLETERLEFQNYVEQVNEEFFLRLIQNFPSITATEKRLAALLRMNLSSKEIATIMNITPKSVDMNRYRLRKKFEIEKEVSLSVFISKI
jgi:DNA-binding CsgD family transcriptional regulator/tetratricopeptide (TPR) repeat protein